MRRAPNVAFGNPGTASDGLRTSDQLDLFNGSPERYDWTLVGKREIYVPYNSYLLHSDKLKYKLPHERGSGKVRAFEGILPGRGGRRCSAPAPRAPRSPRSPSAASRVTGSPGSTTSTIGSFTCRRRPSCRWRARQDSNLQPPA